MSQYVPQQCRRVVFALLALGIALPAQARDIVDTPGLLFFTRDETPGIQLLTPETTRFDDLGNPIPRSGCCDERFFGNAPEPFIGPFGVFDVDQLWLQQDDFTDSSLSQFRELGEEIGRQAIRPRIRPFLASWMYDTNEDEFVLADRALGPMLADRPQTMGKGRMAIGWSYQQVNWDRLNGQDLDSLQFTVLHKFVYSPAKDDVYNGVPNPTPGQPHPDRVAAGDRQGQETDVIPVEVDMKLEQDFVDFYVEYGVSNSFDVGLVIPFVQTKIDIRAETGFVQQADRNDPTINRTEPGLDDAYAFYPGAPPPGAILDPSEPPRAPDEWTTFYSRRSHTFCNTRGQSIVSFQARAASGPNGNAGQDACPGNSGTARQGDPSPNFNGGIIDTKETNAIGIGDIRIRAKWHALKSGESSLLPDLAWVAELRPPTGIEGDLNGTGAFAATNFFVGSWTPPALPEYIDWLSGFRPHWNVGVELSTGPSWQDSAEWAVGFEAPVPNLYTLVTRGQLRGVEWLSFSFDQLGRIPFGDEVADRYEYGGGLKMVPYAGVGLYFDFIRPINENDGITADFTWRVGGQVQF